MIKKFTTFLLAFAMVISFSVPRSSAVGLGTVVSSVTKYTLAAVGTELALNAIDEGLDSFFGSPQAKQFAQELVADGIFTLADYIAAGFTDQDYYDQFISYNTQLETDLGTTTLIDGGVRLLAPPRQVSASSGVTVVDVVKRYGFISADVMFTGVDQRVTLSFESVRAPFHCNYSGGFSYSGGSAYPGMSEDAPFSGSASEGTYLFYSHRGKSSCSFSSVSSTILNSYFPVVAQFWVDVFPAGSTVTDFTGLDITPVSRPTTLTSPVAIQNSDQTYTVYNNITLVDEGNNVVFDPTTGESITFTDWAYDYDSRTYDLTLDGGGNMTVQFGDDSITMTQGDTVTNVFYVQDPADDPGTDPDNPGTDADVSGFFAWWKDAWNGFVDRLFTVLNGGDLEVILPGEEGNPEDEEDDGWNVFDLFALIRDALWEIITGVIRTALDGFLGLVQAIAGLGDFFTVFDRDTEGGVLDILNQGGSAVWE